MSYSVSLSSFSHQSTCTNSDPNPNHPSAPVEQPTTPMPFPPHSPSSSADSSPTDIPKKEKRKRSRVTPDQLFRLEHFFAIDRSPTATRRREIAALLDMNERQTQIWFQNRRAKAKQLDAKHGRLERPNRLPVPPPPPPPDVHVQRIVHESSPISLIACKELSVGTWRRVISPLSPHDLIAYACFPRSVLVWYIHSNGFGFKMEVPFSSILEILFVESSPPGTAQLSFQLSDPPHFYMEGADPRGGPASWKRSTDWTEACQASAVLRHELIGDVNHLGAVVQQIRPYLSDEGRQRIFRRHNPNQQLPDSRVNHPAPAPQSPSLYLLHDSRHLSQPHPQHGAPAAAPTAAAALESRMDLNPIDYSPYHHPQTASPSSPPPPPPPPHYTPIHSYPDVSISTLTRGAGGGGGGGSGYSHSHPALPPPLTAPQQESFTYLHQPLLP